MSVRERIRALRKEARELERASDEQERAESFVDALKNERRGYEARLRRALQLGEKRERIPDGLGGWTEAEESGTQLAARLERRIADVDIELKRCSRR